MFSFPNFPRMIPRYVFSTLCSLRTCENHLAPSMLWEKTTSPEVFLSILFRGPGVKVRELSFLVQASSTIWFRALSVPFAFCTFIPDGLFVINMWSFLKTVIFSRVFVLSSRSVMPGWFSCVPSRRNDAIFILSLVLIICVSSVFLSLTLTNRFLIMLYGDDCCFFDSRMTLIILTSFFPSSSGPAVNSLNSMG